MRVRLKIMGQRNDTEQVEGEKENMDDEMEDLSQCSHDGMKNDEQWSDRGCKGHVYC